MNNAQKLSALHKQLNIIQTDYSDLLSDDELDKLSDIITSLAMKIKTQV